MLTLDALLVAFAVVCVVAVPALLLSWSRDAR